MFEFDAIAVVILGVLCVAIIRPGITDSARMLEFPALAALVVALWLLPQAIGLLNDELIDRGMIGSFVIMVIFSLGALWIGFHYGQKGDLPVRRWGLDDRICWRGGVVLLCVGYVFQILLGRLPEELTSVSEWTGLPVAYLFFALSLKYAFAIFVLHFLKHRDAASRNLALLAMLPAIYSVIASGRRAPMLDLAIVPILLIWFAKRRAPATSVIFVGAGAFMLFSFSVHEYRALLDPERAGYQISEFTDIGFLDNVLAVIGGGGSEIRNAVLGLRITDIINQFDYGATQWAGLVQNFVPAQIVGEDFKNSLKLSINREFDFTILGYERPGGTTGTGFLDAYASFGYLGSLVFGFWGYVYGRIYRAGLAGIETAQLLYAVTMVPALHMVTHSTVTVSSALIHALLFTWPILFLARTEIPLGGGIRDSSRRAII